MLVQHHEKYEEIHGEDKIVMMEYGEHRKLHARLRKEGKCTIPRDELHEISIKAYRRTEKGKAMLKEKEARRHRKRKSERILKYFSENVDTNIGLVQIITYYLKSGHVGVRSSFRGYERRKVIFIDI
jgi:hypothetical protein